MTPSSHPALRSRTQGAAVFKETEQQFQQGSPIAPDKIKLKKAKIPLDKSATYAIIQKLSDSAIEHGGIAQLGERLNGIQEVSGSIPLISTKNTVFHHEIRCFSNFCAGFVV